MFNHYIALPVFAIYGILRSFHKVLIALPIFAQLFTHLLEGVAEKGGRAVITGESFYIWKFRFTSIAQ